jgi:hypothetical protein
MCIIAGCITILGKVFVDFTFWLYTEKYTNLNLKLAWIKLTSSHNLTLRIFPAALSGLFCAVSIMLQGFHIPQTYMSSRPCDFVKYCIPYPCSPMCLLINNQTVAVNNTMYDPSLPVLPEFLDYACRYLDTSVTARDEMRQWPAFSLNPGWGWI